MAEPDRAGIVVGIPSYNSADSIGHVVAAVDLGLSKYFAARCCATRSLSKTPGTG